MGTERDGLQVAVGNAPRDPEEVEATAGACLRGHLTRTTVDWCISLSPISSARSCTTSRRSVFGSSSQGGRRVGLGVEGRELLVLVEEAGAKPAYGHTGLYHFALLLPERRDLARWVDHAARDHVPLVGASDTSSARRSTSATRVGTASRSIGPARERYGNTLELSSAQG